MIHEAEDFRAESRALHALLRDVGPSRFAERTQFKNWTVEDILQHLHFWNEMAVLSLTDEARLQSTLAEFAASKTTLRDFEARRLGELRGAALLATWRTFADVTADRYVGTEPGRRLKWAGPDMSARSAIAARLMETWAHGQAIYDRFGRERADTDRIKSIAHLGVRTFGWSFAAKGREPPGEPPHVRLVAPSGALWAWHAPSDTDYVSGSATEFCQVVAQTRNVADTQLEVVGETAREWMSIAQCFAGPGHMPPPAGTRFRRDVAPPPPGS